MKSPLEQPAHAIAQSRSHADQNMNMLAQTATLVWQLGVEHPKRVLRRIDNPCRG